MKQNQLLYALLMAASAMLMGTSGYTLYFHQVSGTINGTLFSVVLFTGTFIAYSLPAFSPSIHVKACKVTFRVLNNGLIFILLITYFILLYLLLPFALFLQYYLAGILSFLYSASINTSVQPILGLRSVFIVKNIVLALAWALATAPVIPGDAASFLLFLNRFSFLMALSILIDIRDLDRDHVQQTPTLPLVKGVTFTKVTVLILLLAGPAFIHQYTQLRDQANSLFMASVISSISTLAASGLLSRKSGPAAFLVLVDGNLLLHALLFWFMGNPSL